jgi:RNA polymerase sigma-70 factor (ECF subfamily)
VVNSFHTSELHRLLTRLQAGDRAAWDELYAHTETRLYALARRMLHGYPGVRRFEDTSDVLQNATLRLLHALRAVRPGSVREFFALAGTQLRRELLDMKGHYFGPQGAATHMAAPVGGSNPDPAATAADAGPTPAELEEWAEFHRQIEGLPAEERAVVDLHFYQGLSKAEAAEVLGVDARTVQRRWNAALGRLKSVRHGEWPPL